MKHTIFLLCLVLLYGCQSPTSNSKENNKILRTCLANDIATVDPRTGVSMHTQSVVRMLFTGLVRLDNQLNPQLELAESYRTENNFKTYIFSLKQCCWSDGSPITAYDFEESWKAALSPAYSSGNTNLFFHIKNGKKIILGKLSIDHFGAKAIDDRTLVIELEEPNSCFLDVLTNSIFSPVHQSMRHSPADEKHLITSGPFCLKKHLFQDQIVLEKNPHYWNAPQVQLQELHYYIIKDYSTSLNMFQKGEVDWLGEPMTRLPVDSIPNLKKTGHLHWTQTLANQWLFLNTTRFPLNNANIRKALSYAIDREKIMKDIMYLEDTESGQGLIPKVLKKEKWHSWFKNNDLQQIRRLFNLGLQELGITLKQFPTLTIHFGTANKMLEAIQQMWEQRLGIKVQLERLDGPMMVRKYFDQDYQIAWVGWVIQYKDPINMLEIFKTKNVQPNYTGWEHPDFIRYTQASYMAHTEKEKWDNVEAAEKIFCDEMPSISVIDTTAFYLTQPYVKNVFVNPLLLIDFDRAIIER